MPAARPRTHHPGPHWARARAHALTAATRWHLPVIPTTRTKLPALPAAHPDTEARCTGACGALGHGIHDATADPERVREMFAAAPWAAGYAIACGRPPHHLIGIDLDTKNGQDGVAELAALARRFGFAVPRTVTVATPSGGRHLWLTAPPGARIPNSASRLAPGIDVRGSGGYLVGPGSLGPGGRYAFTPGRGPAVIAPIPARLTALLAASQEPAGRSGAGGGSGPSTGRLGPLVRFVQAAGEGELNNRLYWASCRAFEDTRIDPQQAAAELLDAAVSKGHPPVGAERTIASARRRTQGVG